MNFKSPQMIVLYCLFGITILCFSLMQFSNALSIIGSITFTASFAMITWMTFVNYLKYKGQMADKRLSDAYVYAEELGDESAMKNFTYDAKTERKLKYEKFNKFLIPFSFFAITLAGFFLFLVCVRII